MSDKLFLSDEKMTSIPKMLDNFTHRLPRSSARNNPLQGWGCIVRDGRENVYRPSRGMVSSEERKLVNYLGVRN